MCGLIHAVSDTHYVRNHIFNAYIDQNHRGRRGFGIIYVDSKGIIHRERYTQEETALFCMGKVTATEMAFHHRFPTSTKNTQGTAHPFIVSNKILKHDYYFMHNGVIRNADELKKNHEKLGFSYEGIEENTEKFNDSEALAVDFALVIEGKQKKTKAQGQIAFIAYQVDKKTKKPTKRYFFRDNNPLLQIQEENALITSSENKVKEATELEKDMLYTYDYSTGQTKKRKLTYTQYVFKTTQTIGEPRRYDNRWGNQWDGYGDTHRNGLTYRNGSWQQFVKPIGFIEPQGSQLSLVPQHTQTNELSNAYATIADIRRKVAYHGKSLDATSCIEKLDHALGVLEKYPKNSTAMAVKVEAEQIYMSILENMNFTETI